MKTYLEADGYEVDHTPDPAEAVEFASRARYGVVITDLVMSSDIVALATSAGTGAAPARVITGLDLYREIKSYDARKVCFYADAVVARGAAADGLA